MNYLGFTLRNNLFVAPMAGVTDRPFRQLCKKLGAGLAVSEMVTSNSLLYGSAKTRRRADHTGEVEPIVVQIAGADPELLAQAARYNVERDAQIVDINMGCPAKKVCNVMAGSALMQNEALVAKILETVVAAIPDTPVTLKFRTGWNREHKNAPAIAHIAQESGVRAIAIHGRTRADQYTGHAEYDTIADVKTRVNIPVIANGDITTPEKAKYVLDYTQADGVMIGRAAQGRTFTEIHTILRAHLADLYAFYGEDTGVRIARKHISWYTKGIVGAARFRHAMNQLEDIRAQLDATDEFFLGQMAHNLPIYAEAA